MNDEDEEWEWFKGLTPDEIDGKHVRVIMNDGSIIEGRLNDERPIITIGSGISKVTVFYLNRAVTDPYYMSADIESISLVWDERDWKEVDAWEISGFKPGDYAIVVSGHLYNVKEYRSKDSCFLCVESNMVIPEELISSILKKKPKLPTEPGTYRSNDGTQILCRLEDCDSWQWVAISTDMKYQQVNNLTDEKAEQYMPLTPVHFVDGWD